MNANAAVLPADSQVDSSTNHPDTPSKPPVRRAAIVIALAVFATYLASGRKLGSIPLQFMIKDELSLSAEDMAVFFAIANFAWYARPLGGLISDHVPFFGTRRRHYLLVGSLMAACCWGLLAIVPRTFGAVLAVVVALNFIIVIAHSAAGGLLVERAKASGTTGPLTAMRVAMLNSASLISSITGGFLATAAPIWTSAIGALPLLLTTIAAGLLLREEPSASRPSAAAPAAASSVPALLRSGTLWSAIALSFAYYVVPSPATIVLLYHRTGALGFSKPAVGTLDALQEIGGMLGILAYAAVRRRVPYRTMLFGAVPIKLCAVFLFFAYQSKVAAFVLELPIGFLDLFSVMAIQELAARAAPPKNEAFGFAMILGLGNAALSIASLIASSLHTRWSLSFHQLLWVQASSFLLVLFLVPFTPRSLTHEG